MRSFALQAERAEFNFPSLHQIKDIMSIKLCNVCLEEFPLTKEYFYSNGFTPKGTQKWKPSCKSCENTVNRERYDEGISIVFPILKCEICGYNKCRSALHFHHENPKDKEYSVSSFASSKRNREILIAELKKCRLLCSNCHAEVHAGITILPTILLEGGARYDSP